MACVGSRMKRAGVKQMVAKIKRLREIPLAKEAAEREAGRRDETEQTQLLACLAISAKQCGDVGETLFWGLGPASMSRAPSRYRDESGYASIIETAQLTPCRLFKEFASQMAPTLFPDLPT